MTRITRIRWQQQLLPFIRAHPCHPWFKSQTRLTSANEIRSLLRADDRAAIDLCRRHQRDHAGSFRFFHVSVRRELERDDAVVEHDLHFLPERIESIALNG